MKAVLKFESEAALCDAFIETVPKEWTVYPETCNFDILLAHVTGVQIGIEAKLRLNAKVICQALKGLDHRFCEDGPDFRAVLVPTADGELWDIATRLGLTIITMRKQERNVIRGGGNNGSRWWSDPALPDLADWTPERPAWMSEQRWCDLAPIRRCQLPEYVPEVRAGVSSPLKLTDWKIQAMKVCVLVERTGAIHRLDFKKLEISPTMWTQGPWLAKGTIRGWWVKGSHFPADTFRHQHPSIYAQIEADFDAWVAKSELDLSRPEQGNLL